MSQLTDQEKQLIAQVSKGELMESTSKLASWVKVSGTPAEQEAAAYIEKRLKEFGLRTTTYQVELMLGWPEEAVLEVRSPERLSLKAITHALVPSTDPAGLDGELVLLGTGNESDFKANQVAGKIAVLEGLAAPDKVALGQQYGALALIFVGADDYVRDSVSSPVWGTPTTATAPLLLKIPVESIARADGARLKALAQKGPVKVWMRTRTFWGWRTTPVVVGEVPGAVEPEKFVLFSAHHDSWYYGAMDNSSACATVLETARLVSTHRKQLRRSARFAFWSGHSQGRYAGSTWYADNFWEDLYDNCVLHINADSTGAKGAIFYQARCMAENRDFALAAIRDVSGEEAEPQRMPRAADQSFWIQGISSMFMSLSKVPPELAADIGDTRVLMAADSAPLRRRAGSPWWWHTPYDTIDKIDPEVLAKDTQIFFLATWRATTLPVLPFRYSETAKEIREAVERYQAAAGDRFDLSSTLERARQVEAATAALDERLEQLRQEPGDERAVAIANEAVLALGRSLTMLDFTANGPFDQDLALPMPIVGLLRQARQIKEMDPTASETRFLTTELTRNRNKVNFYLREALKAATGAASALR